MLVTVNENKVGWKIRQVRTADPHIDPPKNNFDPTKLACKQCYIVKITWLRNSYL